MSKTQEFDNEIVIEWSQLEQSGLKVSNGWVKDLPDSLKKMLVNMLLDEIEDLRIELI